MIKRNLLLLNKLEQGTLYPFPSNFELPPRIVVGRDNIEFFKTDRLKTINGEALPVYVEGKNSQIDLDKLTDPIEHVEKDAETSTSKTDTERISNLRKILAVQIDWYLNNKDDESRLYDEMHEQFSNNLSRVDFIEIMEELTK